MGIRGRALQGLAGIAVAASFGCTPVRELSTVEEPKPFQARVRPDHVFAIYNDDNLLVTDVLSQIATLVERNHDRPYTDVYVVSHGWNFTISGAHANYEAYLDSVARVLTEDAPGPDVKPLIVLVCWTSVTKPASEAARSMLPFGLDESIALVTGAVDTAVFHLASLWKQSINASTNALGRRLPDRYLLDPPDPNLAVSRSARGNSAGFDLPVSALLFHLMEWNRDLGLGNGKPVRLHCAGHSFGSKLLLLAAIESLRRYRYTYPEAENGIDSLTLFNAAMHPSEVSYRTANLGEDTVAELDVVKLLSEIPRKAFVYSRTDLTMGLTFDLSQIVINNMHAQRTQQVANEFIEESRGSPAALFMPVVYVGLGAVQFAWSSLVGVSMWTVRRVVNLPQDLAYHVTDSTFLDCQQNVFGGVARFFHFFLPLDEIYAGHVDQQGLFRASTGGLGKSGLARHASGRGYEVDWCGSASYSNTGALRPFAGAKSDVPADEYVRLASRRVPPRDCRYGANDEFYSFDASSILHGKTPFVGSHGMLRDPKCVLLETPDGAVRTRIIDSTVRFVLNFSHGESTK